MKKIYLMISIGCFLFLVFCFLLVFVWQGIYLPRESGVKKERAFLIKKGEGTREIASNLQKEGIIKHRLFFQSYTFFKNVSGKLQAGKYLLSPSMSIPEITEKFVSGEVVKEKITIIEGWNLRDIGWYFENKGFFQAEELFELVGFPLVDYSKTTDFPKPKDFSDDFNFLKDKPKNVSLEGYLFPDTYFIDNTFPTIVKNVSLTRLEKIVRKMLENFGKKLTPELREEINRQEKSIFEIVTMASMLEKEVKSSEDRKLVSGILWKRLEEGIPLQVDATITYITGKKTTKISKEETEVDSPYNTYKYKGLPLGPISNPGLDSILAAVYPKESAFWYYLSIPSGETIFSKTLEEHNIAKAKYLR